MKNVYSIFFSVALIFSYSIEAKPFLYSIHDTLNTPDSTIADHFKIKADSLYNISQYDSAVVYYEKGAELYERIEDWNNYTDCLSNSGECFIRNGKYNKAINILKVAKAIALNELNEKNLVVVKILSLLSFSYIILGDYEIARRHINEAIVLSGSFNNDSDIETTKVFSMIYNCLGGIDIEAGNYEDAINNTKKSLNIILEYAYEIPATIGSRYSNLASTLNIMGYYKEAMVNYEKALEFYSISSVQANNLSAIVYNGIALILSESKGDYDEALRYEDKALSIFIELFGEESPYVAMAYYNKGDFFLKKGNLDEALNFFNKALKSYKAALKTEKHTDVAMTYNSIGEVYESMSNYNKANEYYQKALSIRLKIFGEQHADVGKNYNDIGSIARIQNDYAEAAKYHEKALRIFRQTYGNWHLNIAESYNLLGLVYRELNNYDMALQQFQKSFIANVPSFSNEEIKSNPEPEGVLSEPKLLESLNYKAETLTLWYDEEMRDINLLRLAFDTYKTMSDLNEKMRSGYKAEGSKIFLAEKSSEIFDKAIELSIRLYALTGENKYKEEAYYFCERSKARILQEAISESEAKHFSGIPDSLLNKEYQLRTDLTFYENRLQEGKYKKEGVDSLRIKNYENRLFTLNMEYRRLVEELEQSYPKYYSSKYLNKKIELDDVQKSLADNEALLEYFIGSEAIYLFYFSSENYELITIKIDSQLDELVSRFYTSIKKIDKKEYISSANQLHEILVKPVKHQLVDKEKLVIIPDGELYYVPFEALITEADESNSKNFSKQNYLINQFEISYNYSTSFLVDPSFNSRDEITGKGFVGFAPVFNNSPKAEHIISQNIRSYNDPELENNIYRFLSGNEIRALPYSEEELKYILDLFKERNQSADGYFYDAATKENFKSEAGKYKYVHLATHSFVNPEKPQFSGIILSQPEDTVTSTGTIYSNEIYNLDLSADLVVLSSCESGIGKLVKGEGMLALTRGFLYSGVKNIIISLWKVYDKSTAELMKSFYTNMLNGDTYSRALRKAKLEMINNKQTSFPVNWSGFVLIGQ